MIQLLYLRKFTPKDSTDGKEIVFDKLIPLPKEPKNVADLFANLSTFLDHIPAGDRWNVFYTVANCDVEKRKFKSTNTIAFDFDGIERTLIREYITIACNILQVMPHEVGQVSSGHGLHILVPLATAITDKNFFEANRHHYKAVYTKCYEAFKDAGLPITFDVSVFEPRRILRLPGTVNRKPNKLDTLAELLQARMVPQDFCLKTLSGLPNVSQKDSLSERTMARYPKVDSNAVLAGCNFLKHAKENAGSISEPEWYAALSITARLENGTEISHEFSKLHPKYSKEETDKKIEQALDASGPRKCDNIAALGFDCHSCPNYKQVVSPILITGDGHISTELTGFHKISIGGRGQEVLTPDFEGLRKYYAREHKYKTVIDSGHCYTWNGKFYEFVDKRSLDGFAVEHYNPTTLSKWRKEFIDLVLSTELVPLVWFNESIHKKVNFLNGYFDIERKDFLPHTPDVGFRAVLPFEYNEHATCPTYTAMMKRITMGDEQLENLLNQIGGYVVSGDSYWLHHGFILTGDGSNGKSTWLRVLSAILGPELVSSVSLSDLKEPSARQKLDKKLLNIAEEMPSYHKMDTELFKNLTSGGNVYVRAPYGQGYDIRNKAKMLFTCNEMPSAYDTSWGFMRRLIIAPFNYEFKKDDPEYDPMIEDKLLEEIPGIFNLLIKAYYQLCEAKMFKTGTAVDGYISKYRSEIDSASRWISENLVTKPLGSSEGKNLPVRDIYTAYVGDAQTEKDTVITMQKFAKKIAKMVKDYELRHKVMKVDKDKTARCLVNSDIIYGAGIGTGSDSSNIIQWPH